MIIAKILGGLYVFYFLKKTELLNKIEEKKRYLIYLLLVLLALFDTKINIFNYSFDFLIVGFIVCLFEILLKYLKIETKYLFLKIYIVILLVLLLCRGGLWISQQL